MNRKVVIAMSLFMLASQAMASERLMPVGAMHGAHAWKTVEPLADDVRDVRAVRMVNHVDATAPAPVEHSVMHHAPAQSSNTAQGNAPWWRGPAGNMPSRLAGTPCDSR